MRFGISAVGPAEKAYRRGEDEAGFEAFGRGVLGTEAFDRLSPERRAQAWDNVAVDKAQLLGEGFPPLSDAEVRGVAAPTLLMHAERSPQFLRLLTDGLEELLPNVGRLEVPEASHIMHEDNPGVVNEAILTFVGGLVFPLGEAAGVAELRGIGNAKHEAAAVRIKPIEH